MKRYLTVAVLMLVAYAGIMGIVGDARSEVVRVRWIEPAGDEKEICIPRDGYYKLRIRPCEMSPVQIWIYQDGRKQRIYDEIFMPMTVGDSDTTNTYGHVIGLECGTGYLKSFIQPTAYVEYVRWFDSNDMIYISSSETYCYYLGKDKGEKSVVVAGDCP